MSTTADRYDTDLWDATATTFGSTGSVTIPLNASGISVVQGWVTSPTTNYGVVTQYVGTGTTADYWIVASKENTSYSGATLNITYSDSSPSITTTGTLSAFTTPLGTPSAEQSYTVSGSNLTDALVITAPADFQVSTTSGSFSSNTLSLTPTSGTVATTTIYVRLNPSSATTYSGNITNASTGATTVNVAVSGSSVPTITTGTLSAFSAAVGAYSAEQTYTVTGSNLTSNLVITPPANFEISKTTSTGFVDSTGSLTYTPTSGVLASQTIYVRFKSASAGTFSGNITYASGSTTFTSTTVSGTASAPTLAASGTLTFFNSSPSVYSSAQSFTVSGSYLTGSVTVTAPTGYVVSTSSSSGYASSLTLTPTSGTLSSTTIYVELYSTTAGAASGNIAVTSSGATEADVAATGYVYAWRAFNDCNTYTSSQSNPTNTTKIACYSASSANALKNYDTGTSSGATFTVAVSSSGITYNTGNGTATNSATDAYNTFNGYANLIDVIKLGSTSATVTLTFSGLDSSKTYAFVTTSNRADSTYTYNTDFVISDIANTTITNASTSGVSKTTSSIAEDKTTFNTGYNTVTGYVARWTGIQPGSDGDFTVTYTTTSTQGYGPSVFMLAEENDTTPKITTSASSLTGFTSTPGAASTAQTVTVTGSNLTSSIAVSAPTDFQVSSDGSTYDSTATLSSTGGTLYVRMLRSTEGTPSGDITLSSTGATSKTISVSGTVLYRYTLTVTTDGNGTVALSPSGGTYDHGTTVTLTPTGNTGYKFSDWSGEDALSVVDTSGVYTIVMNGNKSISANFAAKEVYTISADVSPSAGGSVAVSPSSGPYYEGDSVIFTATANSGYEFSGWTGSSTSTTNPLTMTLSGNVYLTAVFNELVQTCTDVSVVTTKDTWIHGSSATYNYGASTTLYTHGYNTGRGTLIQWDLSSIPTNATIESASLTIQVTDASLSSPGYIYNLYQMRQSWVEGTGNGSATADGATFNSYDGNTAHTWETGGAAGTTTDRYSTNLWDAGVITATGVQTFNLNTAGVAAVQSWVTTPATNFGLTMQNYVAGTTTDTFGFYSSDSTTGTKPTLNVSYCTSSTPTYTLTAANDGNGSVTLSPSGGTYESGTVVTMTPVPSSGYKFTTWSGTNADDAIDNGDGTWSITMNESKSLTANFTLIPVNVAPDAPVLTAPTNGATGTSLSPTLSATVSDGNSDDLTVNFYGRKTGTTAGADFTFVLVPDPQNLVTSNSAALTSQFNWIVNNASSSNIVFVSTTGDLVNTATSTTEYSTIDSKFDLLDTAGIPYSVGPGNHDYPLSNYNTYFGTSRFSGKSWYGGYYDSSNENNYSFFSASGNDFIVVNLGYNPSSTILSWADSLLTTYSSKRAIVISHSIINIDNSWTDEAIFTALKGHSNLFLMLCGHMHSSTDGSAYRAETATDGHTVHIMQADYQDYSQGYLRILRFSPANDMIYGTTYSPYTSGYLTSTSNYESTSLAYDLASGSSAAYTLIGTTTAASGTTASITWSGLSGSTEYEWYATATDPDGETVASASSYSFTTGTGVNTAPVLGAIGSKSVNELSLLSFTASATDDGLPSGTLTYSLAAGTSGAVPSGAAINSSTGAFTWTPTEAQGPGSYTFDVCVSDGSLSDCETITVTVAEVNTAPVITESDPQALTVVEDTPTTLTLHATDSDGNTLTWSISTLATHGTAAVSSTPTGTSQVITYTPASNSNTADSFVVQVSDGSLTDTLTVNVSITAVNDAPDITESSPQTLTVAEDSSGTLTLHATDVDTASSSLTWSISTLATHGTAAVSSTPTGTSQVITYTPASNSNTADSFVVQVSDGSLTDTLTVNVTVTPSNDAPVITETSPQAMTVTEDSSATLTLHATDVDTASSSLTWSISTLASHGTASVSSSPTGASQVITYTPTANSNTADTFVVQVSDGSLTAVLTVNVTVTPVPDAPVITESDPQTLTVAEDGSASLTLHATDVDTSSSSLTWSISTLASHGTAAVSSSPTGASQVITYTPTANYASTDTFVVQVSDGSLTDTLTVNVSVTPSNDAPVITEGDTKAVTMSEDGSPIAFSLTLNATDIDSSTLTWSISTAAGHGTATASGTGLSKAIGYTPNANYNGTDTFVVQASDGSLVDTITITVTIEAVNDAPVANTDYFTLNEDETHTYNVSDLLANDTDVDSSTLSITGVSNVVNILSIGLADPYIYYTPMPDFHGTASFDYTLSDGTTTSTGTVIITVVSINDAPILPTIDDQTINELSTLSFAALAVDFDTEDTLTYSLKAGTSGAVPTGMTITTDSGNGYITWTPTETQGPGTYTFDVCVSDGTAETCQTVHVTVNEVNVAPVITEGSAATVNMSVNGSPTAFSLTLNATDADYPANTLTWSLKTAASHGTAGAAGTGSALTVTYTPVTDYVGTDSFEVQVSDGAGGTDSITVSVNVSSNTGSQTISLVTGWNLISFKVHPSNTAIASILSSISGNYDLVYAWNASSSSSDKWLIYDPAASYGNTLTTLDNTQGFWVHMTAADDLVVSGTIPTSTSLSLFTGWNLIGYPSNSDGTLPTVLSALGTNYSLVYGYDSSNSSAPWLLYDRTGATYANTLTRLQPGWGYWIKTSADATLTITY